MEDASAVETLNKRTRTKIVHIYLDTGERLKGKQLMIAPDSTRWVDLKSGEPYVMPTDEIARVKFRNPGKGIIDGLGIGMLGGGLGGVLAGSFDNSSYLPKSERQIVYGVALGVVSGGFGMWFGAILGSEQFYEITFSEPDSQ